MKKMVIITSVMMMVMINSVWASSHKQQEINKQHVVAFYNQVVNQKNFTAAEKYLGSHYIQHDPTAIDGPEGVREIVEFLRTNYPNAHSDIKRIFADGDYVILHVHSLRVPEERGRAIVNMFKLENGKIVEHWEVAQDIPEHSANDNGIF